MADSWQQASIEKRHQRVVVTSRGKRKIHHRETLHCRSLPGVSWSTAGDGSDSAAPHAQSDSAASQTRCEPRNTHALHRGGGVIFRGGFHDEGGFVRARMPVDVVDVVIVRRSVLFFFLLLLGLFVVGLGNSVVVGLRVL